MSLAEETEAGSSPASRLLELIGEKVPADRADAVRAFTQAYLRRLSGDATEGISDEHLLAVDLPAPQPFERTPMDLFASVITEEGPLSRDEVARQANELSVHPVLAELLEKHN